MLLFRDRISPLRFDCWRQMCNISPASPLPPECTQCRPPHLVRKCCLGVPTLRQFFWEVPTLRQIFDLLERKVEKKTNLRLHDLKAELSLSCLARCLELSLPQKAYLFGCFGVRGQVKGLTGVSHHHWTSAGLTQSLDKRSGGRPLCVDFGDVMYLCWPTGLEHLVQAILPQLLRKLGVQLPVAAPGLFLKLSINEVLSGVSIHAHTRV